MKVDGTGKVGSVAPGKRKKTSDGEGDFGSFMEEDDAASVSETSSVATVNPFLALQEVAEEPDDLAKEKKQGYQMLDKLDELKLGILSGGISPSMLAQLKQSIINERAYVSDPRLNDIINAIEVRAKVELAKLDKNI